MFKLIRFISYLWLRTSGLSVHESCICGGNASLFIYMFVPVAVFIHIMRLFLYTVYYLLIHWCLDGWHIVFFFFYGQVTCNHNNAHAHTHTCAQIPTIRHICVLLRNAFVRNPIRNWRWKPAICACAFNLLNQVCSESAHDPVAVMLKWKITQTRTAAKNY